MAEVLKIQNEKANLNLSHSEQKFNISATNLLDLSLNVTLIQYTNQSKISALMKFLC